VNALIEILAPNEEVACSLQKAQRAGHAGLKPGAYTNQSPHPW